MMPSSRLSAGLDLLAAPLDRLRHRNDRGRPQCLWRRCGALAAHGAHLRRAVALGCAPPRRVARSGCRPAAAASPPGSRPRIPARCSTRQPHPPARPQARRRGSSPRTTSTRRVASRIRKPAVALAAAPSVSRPPSATSDTPPLARPGLPPKSQGAVDLCGVARAGELSPPRQIARLLQALGLEPAGAKTDSDGAVVPGPGTPAAGWRYADGRAAGLAAPEAAASAASFLLVRPHPAPPPPAPSGRSLCPSPSLTAGACTLCRPLTPSHRPAARRWRGTSWPATTSGSRPRRPPPPPSPVRGPAGRARLSRLSCSAAGTCAAAPLAPPVTLTPALLPGARLTLPPPPATAALDSPGSHAPAEPGAGLSAPLTADTPMPKARRPSARQRSPRRGHAPARRCAPPRTPGPPWAPGVARPAAPLLWPRREAGGGGPGGPRTAPADHLLPGGARSHRGERHPLAPPLPVAADAPAARLRPPARLTTHRPPPISSASVSACPQIPLTEWSDENPARGTSFWAANVVAVVVAFQALNPSPFCAPASFFHWSRCATAPPPLKPSAASPPPPTPTPQGEPELIPWAARVAAGRLPVAFRRAAAGGGDGGAASRANAEWAHNCSLLLAARPRPLQPSLADPRSRRRLCFCCLRGEVSAPRPRDRPPQVHALARALPREWAPLRKAERAAMSLARACPRSPAALSRTVPRRGPVPTLRRRRISAARRRHRRRAAQRSSRRSGRLPARRAGARARRRRGGWGRARSCTLRLRSTRSGARRTRGGCAADEDATGYYHGVARTAAGGRRGGGSNNGRRRRRGDDDAPDRQQLLLKREKSGGSARTAPARLMVIGQPAAAAAAGGRCSRRFFPPFAARAALAGGTPPQKPTPQHRLMSELAPLRRRRLAQVPPHRAPSWSSPPISQ